MPSVLIFGYGNPGRLDDGLGPALAARFEARAAEEGVEVDADYQLTVEDAAKVSEYSLVIFVDASTSGAGPFSFCPLGAASEMSFSTHSVKPEGVLALAGALFGKAPSAYLLGIRGYEFNEFGEGLSKQAEENLDSAEMFLNGVLKHYRRTGEIDPSSFGGQFSGLVPEKGQ